MSISPDHRRIAVGGLARDRLLGCVEVLDWDTGQRWYLLVTETESRERGARSSYGGNGRVNWLSFSPDSQRLVAATHEGLAFWDVNTGERVPSSLGRVDRKWGLREHFCAVFSPDGRWFATGRPVTLWDVERQAAKWTTEVAAKGLAFSPDNKLLATAEDYNRVHLWQVSDGSQVGEVHGQMGPLYGVAFACEGKVLAAWGEGGARVWDLAFDDGRYSFHARPPLRGMLPFGAVYSMSLSLDGKRLATCKGNLVKVWDGNTSRQLATADRAASCVAFSPDGSVLVIAGFSARVPQTGVPRLQSKAIIKLLPIEHVLDPQVVNDQAREAAADLLRGFEERAHERELGNALFALGPHAQAAAPVLSRALSHQRIETRCIALQALAVMGSGAKQAVPAIIERLGDEAPEVRKAAIMALAEIDPQAAAQANAKAVAQPPSPDRPELRDGAWYYQGRSFAEWLQRVSVRPLLFPVPEQPQPTSREAAAIEALGGPRTIPALLAALNNEDGRTRLGAAAALSLYGAQSKDAIEPLKRMLAREPNESWPRAADALARIVRAAKGPVPAELAREIENADPDRKLPAIRAVLHIDPQHAQARKAVIQLVADVIEPDWGDWERARQARGALELIQSLGADAAFAVPQLVAVLEKPGRRGIDTDERLRAMAAQSLGAIGPAAKAAVPALVAALKDRALSVRADASHSLAKVTPDHVPEELISLTASEDFEQRRTAFWAFSHFREKAVPVLQPMLRDKSVDRRREVLEALKNTQAPPALLLPFFEDVAAHDPDAGLRSLAKSWAQWLGSKAWRQRDRSAAPKPNVSAEKSKDASVKALDQIWPVMTWLRAVKSGDQEQLKTVFSERTRKQFEEEGWDKVLKMYQEVFNKQFGDYRPEDFAFQFAGGETAGEVFILHKGKKLPGLRVIKEGTAWKVDER